MSNVFEFNFIDGVQLHTLNPGVYRLEVYGSQGGVEDRYKTHQYYNSLMSYYSGKGGYAKGDITISQPTDIYVYVGGRNGYNGGGKGCSAHVFCGCGGGATDIRIGGVDLENRIIVAGGGGGGSYSTKSSGTGKNGGGLESSGGTATQTTGFALGQGDGGAKATESSGTVLAVDFYPGAGGGYYGGTSVSAGHENTYTDGAVFFYNGSGDGGSGYVSPILENTEMSTGVRTGHGYAKITMISAFPITSNDKNIITVTSVEGMAHVDKIDIMINDNLVDSFTEPTIDPAFNYEIQDSNCNFGNNNVKLIYTMTLADGSKKTFDYIINYIRYGSYMPDNASIEVIEQYLSALNMQIKALRNDLKSILNDKGLYNDDSVKMSDLVYSVDTLISSNVKTRKPVWELRTNVPVALYDSTSSVLNGIIYVLGGHNMTSSVMNGKGYRYDYINDTWSTCKGIARIGATSNVINGKLYFTGGDSGSGTSVTDAHSMYDETTDTWTTKAALLTRMSMATSCVINNLLYVVSGRTYNYNTRQNNQCYDASTNTWSNKTNITVQTFNATSAVHNNKMYVIGGYHGKTIPIYDPSTDTWTNAASIPTSGQKGCAQEFNDKIYVFGCGNDTQCYDPITNKWTTLDKYPMKTPVYFAASSIIDGCIFCIGGRLLSDGTYSKDTACFNLSEKTYNLVDLMKEVLKESNISFNENDSLDELINLLFGF